MGNKGRKFPAEVLTAKEVQEFLACFGPGPSAVRNRAIVVVMWRAGLRCSEVLNLLTRDIDQMHRTVRVRTSKNGRARTSKLDPQAMAVVQIWLATRSKIPGIRSQIVFCTLSGSPLETRYVRAMVVRIGNRAGIEKRVHPHGFRHTFAVELMREGKTVAVISKALGHSSIAVTAKYLAHLEDGELMEAIDSRPEWGL